MQMIYYNPKQLIKTKIATFGQETGVASGVWRLRDNWEQPMKCQRDLFCERFSLCAF